MHIPPRTAGVTAVKAHTSYAARRILLPLQRFVYTETTGGIVLLVAAVTALAWANSPFAATYERFWSLEVALRIGRTVVSHTVREWINDGLMTLFFFVVGLEIKRELARRLVRLAARVFASDLRNWRHGRARPLLIMSLIAGHPKFPVGVSRWLPT